MQRHIPKLYSMYPEQIEKLQRLHSVSGERSVSATLRLLIDQTYQETFKKEEPQNSSEDS